VQKVADRQGKKRWCYNLRNQIWRPLRCFQEKISCWPRYKEFWLSHTWVISSMVLKHPRGLQIRMKCFKKKKCLKIAHFKANTPVPLRATWPKTLFLHDPWQRKFLNFASHPGIFRFPNGIPQKNKTFKYIILDQSLPIQSCQFI
jgi:hypothetical protein